MKALHSCSNVGRTIFKKFYHIARFPSRYAAWTTQQCDFRGYIQGDNQTITKSLTTQMPIIRGLIKLQYDQVMEYYTKAIKNDNVSAY